MNDLQKLIENARCLSWQMFGKQIIFYHPGMFRYGDVWGRYPAISITGKRCELHCEHCKAKLLESMIAVTTPDELIETCRRMKERGDVGCLLTGGFRKDGTLPWNDFIPAIRTIKETTKLFVSIHSGIVDFQTARKLKSAGVNQALLDIIGDEETLKNVYHADFELKKIKMSLAALQQAGIPTVPHIVIGLNHGEIKGEYQAIQIIKQYNPEALVFVSLMPLPGTPMERSVPPSPQEIARVIATARIEIPTVPFSLGCARERGNEEIDVLAIDCGVNRIALPSEKAIEQAKKYGLKITWEKSCCSVSPTRHEVNGK
ncbi:MAG: radical SAM protein [Methanobacteriota archaeon]